MHSSASQCENTYGDYGPWGTVPLARDMSSLSSSLKPTGRWWIPAGKRSVHKFVADKRSGISEKQLQRTGQEVFVLFLDILLLPETNPSEFGDEGEWCSKSAGAIWMQMNYSGNYRCA